MRGRDVDLMKDGCSEEGSGNLSLFRRSQNERTPQGGVAGIHFSVCSDVAVTVLFSLAGGGGSDGGYGDGCDR